MTTTAMRRTLPWLLALASLPASTLTASALTLSGRVVDSQEQRSIDGARIRVGNGEIVTSDAQGFFRLPDVAPGPRLVAVELPGGEGFTVRLQVPARPAWFVELDRARHTPPKDDDEY
jgi:hypothetical protein